MQETAYKKLIWGLKNCNSGDKDSGNAERVFWGRERVRDLKNKKPQDCQKLPGKNWGLTLIQVRKHLSLRNHELFQGRGLTSR